MDLPNMKLADKNFIADDVRMRGFRQRATTDEVLAWLNLQSIELVEQSIPLQQAANRVLSHNVVSEINIPGFSRSMMDGYAIIAANAQGASSYNQLQLQVIGKSMPGKGTKTKVSSGCAIRIMTGAPIPEGANAVIPAENVEIMDNASILIMESVAEGRNIGRTGEDISAGSIILEQGRKLRPQDIALLASIGKKEVKVSRQPCINIVVTGNEILAVGTKPTGFQITNSNGPMLEALSNRDGAIITSSYTIADDPDAIEKAMLADYDVLLITGGTSVGEEDFVPLLLAKLGDLTFHGITMRPSRSTGMGTIGKKYVFLLSGNPVACLCAYDFFAGRFIRRLTGHKSNGPYQSIRKKLKYKLSSMLGRTDYARIRMSAGDTVEPIAISGAAIISSTTQADGFVIVPANKEGYAANTEVEVFLYD
ncbi:MAG: molybdopterin molybdotransferase MoeA [Methylococcales bacterium]